MALNYEQQTAKRIVQEGHNAFVTGKAGTGKTFLLSHLCDAIKNDAKTVSVTCTTGIACKSLPPRLQASTLHSFAGINDGSGSLNHLLQRIDGNAEAKDRWRKTDSLVIDEVSMLSEKIFNNTECIARNVRQESRAFGGIQVIASGDFFQLPPVPRYDDEGNFAFQSKLWDVVFPHTCLLKTVQRQREPVFVDFVNEIRLGTCSPTGRQFADSLARRVSPEDFGVDHLCEIYSTNDEVDFSNFVHLESVDGELHTWRAVDSGDKKNPK